MTPEEIVQYYVDLLILQYVGLPSAEATIEAVVTPVVMDNLPIDVQNAFEIGTAVGDQLDTLGKYAGVTRSGYGLSGYITLDDDDFTRLIQMAIIRNNSGSSLATIQELLHTFFPGEVFVFDYANMRLSYFIDSDVGSFDLAQLFVAEGILPKPMGVQLAEVVYAPNVDSFFGFVTYESPVSVNNSPFNDYTDYQMDWPWLDYSDAF